MRVHVRGVCVCVAWINKPWFLTVVFWTVDTVYNGALTRSVCVCVCAVTHAQRQHVALGAPKGQFQRTTGPSIISALSRTHSVPETMTVTTFVLDNIKIKRL